MVLPRNIPHTKRKQPRKYAANPCHEAAPLVAVGIATSTAAVPLKTRSPINQSDQPIATPPHEPSLGTAPQKVAPLVRGVKATNRIVTSRALSSQSWRPAAVWGRL
ncbi:MAG TPA: hypothetical protein VGK19_15935 [Capsulimonadaceae bacterium]